MTKNNIPIYEKVVLPLKINKKARHELSLDISGQLLLRTKDVLFEKSWEKMINWININGSQSQKEKDLPLIKKFIELEDKFKVDLNKLLKEWYD